MPRAAPDVRKNIARQLNENTTNDWNDEIWGRQVLHDLKIH
jgi:hypothetical protein